MKIIRTEEFIYNVKCVKDGKLLAIITSRLVRVADGNFGDHKSLGDGVSELRIHYGAGYRIYYAHRGTTIILLLCSGGKSNQKQDLEKAKELNKKLKI